MILSTLKSIEVETADFSENERLNVEYLSEIIGRVMKIIEYTSDEIKVNN
jgi:hypothetical protein